MTTAPLETTGTRQLTTFYVGELLLGIEISCIREINRLIEITPVPHAPPAVRGVINLRGDVVTVMDLRTILCQDATEMTFRSRLVIVPSHGEQIGLLVDRVADVLTVSPEDEEPLPANAGGIDGRFFRRVFQAEQQLLIELNVDSVLAETPVV